MDHRMGVLHGIRQGQAEWLEPVPHLDAPGGYGYPTVRSSLPASKPGDEIAVLEHLAGQGYLERRFFDRVRVCRFCSVLALNVREVCPRCTSAQIGRVRTSAAHHCETCRQVFPRPALSCLCLKCGRTFALAKAAVRTVYAYRLTEKGASAEEAGHGAPPPAAAPGIAESSPAPASATAKDVFSSAFIDSNRAVYSFSFFEERVSQEIARVRRYQRTFSVLLASPDHAEAHAAAFGPEATAGALKAVAHVLKESLRDTDVPALHDHDTLACLLPETPFEGACSVAERIRRRIFELNPPDREPKVTLSLGLAAFTEAVQTAREIIDAASRHLSEAAAAGGNCIRPPAGSPATGADSGSRPA